MENISKSNLGENVANQKIPPLFFAIYRVVYDFLCRSSFYQRTGLGGRLCAVLFNGKKYI